MSTIALSLQRSVVWGGFRVWQRNRDAIVRSWKVEVGGIIVEPFIMLVAMGFGLGAFVDDFGDLTYAEFLAGGIIASYAMFHATFDSTFGAYLRMESHHIYEAVLFTPLGPEDIVVGEVMWGATRATLSGTSVLVVACADRDVANDHTRFGADKVHACDVAAGVADRARDQAEHARPVRVLGASGDGIRNGRPGAVVVTCVRH